MSAVRVRRFPAALAAPLPVIFALFLGAYVAAQLPGASVALTAAAGQMVIVIGGILAACVAHDVAHWIAAYALGFRVGRVTVGPFLVTLSRRGRFVDAARRWSQLRGELVAEPRGERRAILRWALVAAAGPAMSLGIAALCWRVMPVLAAASLLRGLIALVPAGRLTAAPNDGARLLVLTGGGAAADRLTALFRIAAAQQAGVRPRAWPERWTIEASALRDGSRAEAIGVVAGFRRALDGCAHDRAEGYLDRALALRALLPRAEACALLADAAYFEARIHDDAVRARAWLEEAAARRSLCPVAERRAAAAVLLAAGDLAAGALAVREALEQLERVEREGHRTLPMESDWLREMLARADCASVLPPDLFAAMG
jgi:hypothetical protein